MHGCPECPFHLSDLIRGPLNNHIYIDWYSAKDPHPAAIPNLNTLVGYMVANGHTHNQNVVTPYRLAKDLDKHPKQIGSLITNRPGFVRVIRNGKSLGYYWKQDTFGGFYPQTLVGHRGRKLLSVEDLKTTEVETVQQFNERMPEMAKQFREETLKPDFELPLFDGQEARVRTIKFSYLPVEIAKDMVQVAAKHIAAGDLTNAAATDIVTALLSLLENTKEKDV